MGKTTGLRVVVPRQRGPLPPLSPDIKRLRPRDYLEWKTLRRWGKLPTWEAVFPGYLLREARENAGLSEAELANRLGLAREAVTDAELATSNPSVQLMQDWASAVGGELTIAIEYPAMTLPVR